MDTTSWIMLTFWMAGFAVILFWLGRKIYKVNTAPPAKKSSVSKMKINWWWPKLDNQDEMKKVAKEGAFVAFFSTVATTIMTMLKFIPIESLFDAVIFAIIGFGILKMSRIAAVAGLVLYILGRLLTFLDPLPSTGTGGIVLTVIFIIAYINATRATFAYRKVRFRIGGSGGT